MATGWIGSYVYVDTWSDLLGDEPWNNRSLYRVHARVGATSWANFYTDSYVNININGDSGNVGTSNYYYYNNSVGYAPDYLGSRDSWVGHDTNGAGSFWYSIYFPTGLGAGSASEWRGMTDFDRTPQTPGAPSVSRNASGEYMTVYTSVPGINNGGPGIDYYHYYYSTDNANFTYWSQAGGSAGFTGTSTQAYYFRTYAHNSDGWSPASASTGSYGVPSAPYNVVGTRSTTTSGRIDVTWSTPTNTQGGVTSYVLYRDGSSLGNVGNVNTYADTGRTVGTSYSYTVVANNGTGYSATSAASTATMAPGVPSAPTYLNSVRTGTNVAISVGASANDYGNAITNYYVQYSTDGSTWSTAVAMTNRAYTYTGLAAGPTYTFRTYSVNSIGSSPTFTSTPLTIPANGKKWNGTTFAPVELAKRWDGSAWVSIGSVKKWNGSAWIDLSP
jgi:hypothetical protein